MNRSEARAVAEELYKLMRNDVKRLVKEAVEEETSEWIGAREAAELLGWSLGTLYNRIDTVPHSKSGRVLRFKKSSLIKLLER